MFAARLFAATLLLVISVLASEAEALGGTHAYKRAPPTGTVTCGSNKYSAAEVASAVNTGGYYLAAGKPLGGYPHRFYNYEGLNMSCSGVPSGPWYEVC